MQIAGFYLWSALWLACAFVGNNPIHVTPVQVNEITSENYKLLYASGHQDFFMTYALLYIFITVHSTIRIQLVHTSLMKYHSFGKIYIFASLWLLITAIVAAAKDGDADVRLSILILTCIVAMLQWVFLFTVAHEITTILGISVFLTKQT